MITDALGGAALLILQDASPAVAAAQPLQVFVSILPERYLVARLAGARAVVSVMVGPGESPATYEPHPRQMANLANAVAARLGSDIQISPEQIECPMDWMGPFYGAPTPACETAIRTLARTEGIFVDPVYSGKALAALIDWVGAGRFAPSDTVIFWHTGGIPALFAEGH